MRDTQFWVPEVYSSIIQPNQTPPRKVSRMQSTLDREIYSRTPDTSYLEASESEVSKPLNYLLFHPEFVLKSLHFVL